MIQNAIFSQTVSRPWRTDIVDSGTAHKLVTIVNIFLFCCLYKVVNMLQINYKRTCTFTNLLFVFEMSCKLHHPFTAVVAGPTGCGKSVWVLRLIDNAREMIYLPPSRIHNCYGKYQPIFNKYPQMQFHEGVPELSSEAFDSRKPTLMIVDDFMSETNQ